MPYITYKVLWVDDDPSIVDSTLTQAELFDLELVHFTNWQDAETELRKNFYAYSAIILDANCKLKRDSLEEEDFMIAVLPALLSLFGEKQQVLPWYILSAGTMSNFSFIMKGARHTHQVHEEEWGPMLYQKDVPDDHELNPTRLFKRIREVAKNSALNVVLYRHSETFAYMGEGKLIDARARKLMIDMLSALYYPEQNLKYQYTGNPLRKVLEYFFRAAHKQGLLPDELFDNNGPMMKLASLFMAGANASYSRLDKSKQVRWGEIGERIFDQQLSMIVKNTLDFTNADSHTLENAPWYIDEQAKDIFFSYVLQMCHVIKWLGQYVAAHPNVAENRQKHRLVVTKASDESRNTRP